MKPNTTFLSDPKFVPIKVILPYTVFAFLWAYFSNSFIVSTVHNKELLKQVLIYKAYFFFTISSIFLYILFYIATIKIRQSEKKYKHLFENAAVSIWEEDFSAVKAFFDQQRTLGVSDWKDYFEKNPQAVKQCASWVRITDFNNQALGLMGVKNKELAPRNLDHYFTEESYETFKVQLIALAQGATYWSGERAGRPYGDGTRELMYQMSVVPGYEEDLSKVLVSILDITERKNVERLLLLKEQRLRQIIDLVPHFIFAKDIEGRFILVNRCHSR